MPDPGRSVGIGPLGNVFDAAATARVARMVRPSTLALLWEALNLDLWEARQREDPHAQKFCEETLAVVERVARERGVSLSERDDA